jgi:hypothetical protein
VKVITRPEEITVLAVHEIDGQYVIDVPCKDYDAYEKLPQVVAYKGVSCGKTGWNSDMEKACYKSGVALVSTLN